ncbi:MAG TPA: metallophosphoesterase [Candidatus Acidoferrum sp.]|nr:metallophosphoesterase [Candidatus Acidoferrum sp.]
MASFGAVLLTGFIAVFGCSHASPSQPPTPRVDPEAGTATAGADTAVLVGAGDIAGCAELAGAQATARLLEKQPGTIFAAGDLAYEKGSAAEFKNCYGTTWGEFKARTRPTPGNHEYADPKATGYFQYWGAQAGPAGKGYYSYELGSWHIVALNTNCFAKTLGGCKEGSPEEAWLKQDLAAHANACILAYGHHALFSSGLFKSHAIHPELKPFWEDLYSAHASLVLAGHEHSYERFAPQNPDGQADPEHGIREIVVGTGGSSHDPLGFAIPNSEVRNTDTYGVLKLTLSPGHYTWQFIPEEGKTFTDSGSGECPAPATRGQ